MDAKTDAEIRATMTDEQILLERKLTSEAIDGAIALGYQNTNKPPSDDHWLAPFWRLGRKQAELEASAALPSDAAQAPICWITKEQLGQIEDLSADAWVYWRETGHVAESDEVPLYAAPVAPAAAAPIAYAEEDLHDCVPADHELANGCMFNVPLYAGPVVLASVQTDERSAFGIWFESEVKAGRLYSADEEMAFAGWQARALIATRNVAPKPLTPRSAAEEIDAVFRRNLDLLIQNLTVSDKNEITWLAISCRGVVQSLYPRKGS